MSYAAVLANAATSYRNAAIQSIVNKADPYNAVTFYRNILAQLPPEILEATQKLLPKEPEFDREFTVDPDMAKEQEIVWKYVRQYSWIVEQALAKYLIENIAMNRL